MPRAPFSPKSAQGFGDGEEDEEGGVGGGGNIIGVVGEIGVGLAVDADVDGAPSTPRWSETET